MKLNTLNDIYNDVEISIDYAFNGKFVLKLYDYLKIKCAKKVEVEEFLKSSAVKNIKSLIQDMEDYLGGGSDNLHKQLREAYGHIPKPQARKIKNYLNSILEDAEKYNYEKRPGRKKRQTK
jgi:ribosomal protein L22